MDFESISIPSASWLFIFFFIYLFFFEIWYFSIANIWVAQLYTAELLSAVNIVSGLFSRPLTE